MLNDLVNKIRQTQLPEKDAEAEQFLKQSFAGIPDAQYILTQTVLVQNIALDQAKGQIQQLQDHLQEAQAQLQTQLQQPPAPAQHTSFLGSLLGRHDPPAPPPSQAFPARPAAAPQYYPPAPAYAPDYAAAPPPPPPPSGGSSFLRSAATTAAGVAAGALAFEGVESLLHGGFGHGGGGFGGGGFGGGGLGDRPVEETVINNYYDDPSQKPGGEEHGREASFDDRGGREASFDDRSDNRDDRSDNRDDRSDDRGAQMNDASYDPGDSQDLGSLDDQDSGDIDDSSSFDDSGDDSNLA